MLGGYEAARHDGRRAATFWPTLDARHEVDEADLCELWRRARSLYANCSEIRMLVKAMVGLCGYLMPFPRTQDDEWNKEAREVFLARVGNPKVFDRAGKLSWRTAQLWLERWAIVDGDAGTALTTAADGRAAFAFFRAAQIWTAGQPGFFQGVLLDAHGAPTRFCLHDFSTNAPRTVPARSFLHYMHEKDPARVRGVTELSAAIADGKDISEINGYSKGSVKLAASFGLVEEKPLEDKAPGMGAALAARKKGAVALPPEEAPPLKVDGIQVVSLAPGRRVTTIHDTRPSNEVRSFIKDLIRSIAYSVGLDPEVVFFLCDMGSAGTRLSLEKLKDWVEQRMLDREEWCHAAYVYVLAHEMAAGRLRRCTDPAWWNVKWVSRTDKSIDLGRVGSLKINLIRECLADADSFTLATEGMTVEQIAERRAHSLERIEAICAKHGRTMQEVMPGSLGSAVPARQGESNSLPAHGLHDDEPEPEPVFRKDAGHR